ncbi:MAG: hypothetical protein C5B50_12660 [Verrucomicrobia bacterium]|nr:MAG: hypothetical protein C5B50_12660 [Verrucomicrobiota bacterium]
MKTHPLALLVCLLFFAGVGSTLHAQPFTIDSSTVGGGGGASTGATYSINGTIGQSTAGGPLSGGNFTVTGGFWSLIAAVQTQGAPRLSITLTPTNTVIVSWPSPSTGFGLQQNTDLRTTTWTTPSETMQDNGSVKFIVINPPSGNRFYRLVKP